MVQVPDPFGKHGSKLSGDTVSLELYDLRSVAADPALPSKAREVVRQAANATSCLAELAQAADTLAALHWLIKSPRGRGSNRRGVTEAALLTSCVVLYARATHTGSGKGERGAINIRAKLSDEQKDDHDAITNLRDRVTAHAYPNTSVSNQIWMATALVAQRIETGILPAAVNTMISIDKRMIERLERQIPVAHDAVKAHAFKRLDRLSVILRDEIDRKTLRELLAAHPFDAAAFFGSEATAMQAFEKPQPGAHRSGFASR